MSKLKTLSIPTLVFPVPKSLFLLWGDCVFAPVTMSMQWKTTIHQSKKKPSTLDRCFELWL